VQFEQPIFSNDFFLFASAQPFPAITAKAIDDMLCSSPDGRIALAMLDLWRENSKRKSAYHLLRAARQFVKHLPGSLLARTSGPKNR
jgi:hypothetical protein